MSEALELVCVGGGNMASAILLGASERGVFEAARVGVVDPNEDKREAFASAGFRVGASLSEFAGAIGERTQVMLAVKPQVLPEVSGDLREVLDSLARPVVWSILAGVPSGVVRERCGGKASVVRLMPNTPSRVGKGATAMALSEGAEAGDEGLARRVFEAIGVVYSIDEDQMDAFTAVAGSGPAYFFAMVEALAEAGERVGLPGEVARGAAMQTAIGAAGLLEGSGLGPGELREAVTSKGGTTAAGLGALAEGGFASLIGAAVEAARDRGAELGRASAR